MCSVVCSDNTDDKNFVARYKFLTLVSSGNVMLCCFLSGSWHFWFIVVPSSARVKQAKRDDWPNNTESHPGNLVSFRICYCRIQWTFFTHKSALSKLIFKKLGMLLLLCHMNWYSLCCIKITCLCSSYIYSKYNMCVGGGGGMFCNSS
jgi:hypothetical protein